MRDAHESVALLPEYVAPSIMKKADETAAHILLSLLGSVPDTYVICGGLHSGKSTLLRAIEEKLKKTAGVNVTREYPKNPPPMTVFIHDDDSDVPLNQLQFRALERKGVVTVIVPQGEVKATSLQRVQVPTLTADEITEIVVRRLSGVCKHVYRDVVEHIVKRVYRFETRLPQVIKAVTLLVTKGTFGEDAIAKACKEVGISYVRQLDPEAVYVRLSQSVGGQASALRELSLLVADYTLSISEKPLTVLFGGPSGVGKSYTAQLISEVLELPFHVEHLNTLISDHSVASLTGAPPGYVGYERKTPFVQFLEKHPCGAVVLFDEIDKAPTTLNDMILSFVETGVWTDARGTKYQTRGYIVIFTTNETEHSTRVGFEKRHKATELLPSMRKEFVSRIDRIVLFEHIDGSEHDIVEKIVEEEAKKLDSKAAAIFRAKVRANMSDIVKLCDKEIGVRPMRAYIMRIKQEALKSVERGEQ